MGSHPINLTLRFLLELTALIGISIWGWNQSDNWLHYLLGIGLPIIVAAIWGTFNVPEDPSRSGKAPIVVPGIVRLLIELSVFGSGAWAFFDLNFSTIAWVMVITTVIHYLFSLDRIKWLAQR